MAIASSLVDRLPMTTGLAYLVVGIVIGPQGWRFIDLDPLRHAPIIERVTEVALLFSLFTAGLKLRVALGDARWHAPVRLASVGMVLTVAGIAALTAVMLRLPWPLALVIGRHPGAHRSGAGVRRPGHTSRRPRSSAPDAHRRGGPERRHRLSLPAARPGTARLARPRRLRLEMGRRSTSCGRSPAGLATGWWLGRGVARFVVYLRREHQQAQGLDDFVALGLIAATYGVAVAAARLWIPGGVRGGPGDEAARDRGTGARTGGEEPERRR